MEPGLDVCREAVLVCYDVDELFFDDEGVCVSVNLLQRHRHHCDHHVEEQDQRD